MARFNWTASGQRPHVCHDHCLPIGPIALPALIEKHRRGDDQNASGRQDGAGDVGSRPALHQPEREEEDRRQSDRNGCLGEDAHGAVGEIDAERREVQQVEAGGDERRNHDQPEPLSPVLCSFRAAEDSKAEDAQTPEDGQTVAVNQNGLTSATTVALPPNARSVTLAVRRSQPGQGVTVPLTIVDACGPWDTFVGGGPTAF